MAMETERGKRQSMESRILTVRGQRVMLDAELAKLYGVEVRALNQAIKRNAERFPADFMFKLTPEEAAALRSQIVILESGPVQTRGRGRYAKYLPYAFTEQGVMRAFVRLRGMIGHNRELAHRLDALEAKYDGQFRVVFDAIRELMAPPAPGPRRRIGFVSQD
jgi:hypothetical protein